MNKANYVITSDIEIKQLDIDVEFIIRSIPGYAYWKDLNLIYLGCNQNFANVAGLISPEDVIGKTDYDFSWGIKDVSIANKFRQDDMHVISMRQTIVIEEKIGVKHSNGCEITVRTEKRPLIDKTGNIIGVLGISVDITEEKENARLLSESQARFRKIAAQVAHDIGSPLAALQMVIPHCNSLPETTRNVLNRSAGRIAEIAENFLSQFKPKEEQNATASVKQPVLIAAELLEILTEKKYQYSQMPVSFISNISQSGAFAFINIDSRAFKRMISNLINNAVDAFSEGIGQVAIDLIAINNQVQLTVTDNGKGIPESVKEKLLNNIQVTDGKANGHGIGFTQIRDTLFNNEGHLDIQSQEGIGSKIILTFPKINTPAWMAEHIELRQNDLILILDDDDSIHDAWETRLEKSAPGIKRQHFKHGNDAINFINAFNQDDKQNIFLLTDYELLRQSLHGLDVIEKTGIKRSILVTSHHSNLSIRDKAKQANTKILPKTLASVVSIKIINSTASII